MSDTSFNNSQPMPMNIGRLFAMAGVSILLCMSLFLAVFTPLPIGLISVLYGRKIALGVSVAAFFVFSLIANFLFGDTLFLGFYLLCLIAGLSLAELVSRGINPVKGIFALGTMFIVLSSVGVYSLLQSENKTMVELLTVEYEKMKPALDEQVEKIKESGNENSLEIEALLTDPKLFSEEVIRTVPSFFMISVFVMLWANMFMLLKSNRLMKNLGSVDFSEFDLLKFKMPERFIFVVIIGLVLALLGDKIGTWYPDIGMTILKVVGVFYFFQGIGIYLNFLDRFNVRGFIRSVLVVLTVMSASYMIALVGVFDMFVDFNKLLQKKEN